MSRANLISLLLVASVALTLSACGGQSKNSDRGPSTIDSPEQTEVKTALHDLRAAIQDKDSAAFCNHIDNDSRQSMINLGLSGTLGTKSAKTCTQVVALIFARNGMKVFPATNSQIDRAKVTIREKGATVVTENPSDTFYAERVGGRWLFRVS